MSNQQKTPDYRAIGEMLHDTRESYHLSVEQVAHDLRIRRQHIIALEEGKLEDIPGTTYAKGYLGMYAKYLGINLSTMLNLVTPEADIHKIPSVSSGHKEPMRVQMAVMLSLAVLLTGSGIWYVTGSNRSLPSVTMVRPVPLALLPDEEVTPAIRRIRRSPCVRHGAALYPPCYAAIRQESNRNTLSVMNRMTGVLFPQRNGNTNNDSR